MCYIRIKIIIKKIIKLNFIKKCLWEIIEIAIQYIVYLYYININIII